MTERFLVQLQLFKSGGGNHDKVYWIKYSVEQNKSSSLEIKGRIARMEADYSSSNLIL